MYLAPLLLEDLWLFLEMRDISFSTAYVCDYMEKSLELGLPDVIILCYPGELHVLSLYGRSVMYGLVLYFVVMLRFFVSNDNIGVYLMANAPILGDLSWPAKLLTKLSRPETSIIDARRLGVND